MISILVVMFYILIYRYISNFVFCDGWRIFKFILSSDFDIKSTVTKYTTDSIGITKNDKFCVDYSKLDMRGRAVEYKDGTFNLSKQTWEGTEPNNKILYLSGYRRCIYNKSHSLGWSLGGIMKTHNLTLGA